ncbi:hypothetical protein [Persephonella sp. IF05-L8]|uniref:hypothetical protein n=1 Tax=Persephonella sp. IF05-L8 TaxID=1158338 RepID=UPI0030B9B0A7
MDVSTSFIPLDSYNNIAFIYRLIGFNYDTNLAYAGIFTFSLAYLLTTLCIFVFGKLSLNKYFIGIFSLWSFLMVVYLGQFSKEISVIILLTLTLYIAGKKDYIFFPALIVILILYAYYFRIYWVIILYFVLFLYFIKNFSKFKYILFLIGFLFLFVIANYKGIFLTDARASVNSFRIGSIDAQSLILNPLKNTSFVTDFLNSIIIFIFFIFPIPIILKLKLKYILFSLWELFNIFLFIKAAYFFKNKYDVPIHIKKRVKFSIIFIISFIFTQSLFEPDYGSFLKHQIGLIPLYLYLMSNYFYYKSRLRRLYKA